MDSVVVVSEVQSEPMSTGNVYGEKEQNSFLRIEIF